MSITDLCDADLRTLDPEIRSRAAHTPACTRQQIELQDTINAGLMRLAAVFDRLPPATRDEIRAAERKEDQ